MPSPQSSVAPPSMPCTPARGQSVPSGRAPGSPPQTIPAPTPCWCRGARSWGRCSLAQQEGGPTHNVPANIGRVPLEVVQSPPQIEVGGDPQIPLTEVDEDGDLSNGVGHEMCYLKPVEVK